MDIGPLDEVGLLTRSKAIMIPGTIINRSGNKKYCLLFPVYRRYIYSKSYHNMLELSKEIPFYFLDAAILGRTARDRGHSQSCAQGRN